MGKPDVFKITFSENKRVYYPGEMVTGNVVTQSRKKLKFRSIRMEFHGEAQLVKSTSKEWNRSDIYFDEKVEIYGKGDGEGGSYPFIEPGEHFFPFHFQIPEQKLPSSFEGKFGYIRYWLKATMDRPWKSNYNSKSAVTILEVVDINEHWALEPIVMERELHIKFMCFHRGSIVAQLKTDRRGYCPGEAIAITGGFCNYTSSPTKPITVSLFQTTTYTMQGNKKNDVNKCVKVSKGERLRPGTPLQWENKMFSIPAIPPTINSCKFIKVSYSLEGFRLDFFWYLWIQNTNIYETGITTENLISVASSRGTLSFAVPIIIGTVPYRQIYASAPPMMSSLNNYPLATAPPLEVNLPSYSDAMATPNIAPPSYAECVFGSARIVDEADAASGNMMGDTSFTPMYAFVTNYEFRPTTANTESEPTRERQIDTLDDGLSDSMDEHSN